MSLLSKLLNGKKPTISDVVDLLQGKGEASARPGSTAGTNPLSSPVQHTQPESARENPSGVSWGDRMPDEPNQYNYYGTFWEFFEDIFHRDFCEYTVTHQENPRALSAYTYYFSQGDRPLLVVELLSQRNSVYKVRRDCEKQGIPYLRFYYDHKGWWNTRAYVIERIRKALAG